MTNDYTPAGMNASLDKHSSNMPDSFTTGHLQTITFHPSITNPTSATIVDAIYGDHTITEPPLLALLASPPVLRLRTVHQHGITALLGQTPPVTRLEHSIGALILVRHAGAGVPEQAAALLHDISHTALSHVIDYAIPCPDGGSYHEVFKMKFVTRTCLPSLLASTGLGPHVLEEEDYPLVEAPAPGLCADRLDYGLRDAVSFGYLELADARQVFTTLRAYPSSTDAARHLAITDTDAALALARGYGATDMHVWGNPAHAEVYVRAGDLIGRAVRSGVLAEDALWLGDVEFWAALRAAVDEDGRRTMDQLEAGLPEEEGLGLPAGTKVRTLDPEVWVGERCGALSSVLKSWGVERVEYIASREAMRR